MSIKTESTLTCFGTALVEASSQTAPLKLCKVVRLAAQFSNLSKY